MKSGIKLIVGLGNPGIKYHDTRHNVGFWTIELIANKYNGNSKFESAFNGFISNISISEHKCLLFLPETFMNLSGEAVIKLVRFYKLEVTSILLIHDELDFPPGIIRLKHGGSANGHNGVQNIIDKLGNDEFWRLRIGIGKSKEINNYVLSNPSKLEKEQIHTAIEKVPSIISKLILGDFNAAFMTLHNSEKNYFAK
ncbi:MAG: aminoacyl-tRNA hydrolase [Coxiellaceae bacterium]|nr:aminoacyl-tRNA hydrolase [Coxiellaceae bacterium]